MKQVKVYTCIEKPNGMRGRNISSLMQTMAFWGRWNLTKQHSWVRCSHFKAKPAWAGRRRAWLRGRRGLISGVNSRRPLSSHLALGPRIDVGKFATAYFSLLETQLSTAIADCACIGLHLCLWIAPLASASQLRLMGSISSEQLQKPKQSREDGWSEDRAIQCRACLLGEQTLKRLRGQTRGPVASMQGRVQAASPCPGSKALRISNSAEERIRCPNQVEKLGHAVVVFSISKYIAPVSLLFFFLAERVQRGSGRENERESVCMYICVCVSDAGTRVCRGSPTLTLSTGAPPQMFFWLGLTPIRNGKDRAHSSV